MADLITGFNPMADTLFRHSPIGIIIFCEENLIYTNEKITEISGYTKEEIRSSSYWDKIHPDDIEKVLKEGFQRFHEKNSKISIQFRIICKNQKIRTLEANASYITWENELYVIIQAVDYTDYMLSLDALKTSEEMYRTIFENTGTAMIISDDDTTILLANSEFERLSGFKKKDIEGKLKWTSIIASDDLEKMTKYHVGRREGANAPDSYSFKFHDQKGEIRHCFLKVSLIPGTRKSAASILDVSDLYTAQREAKEAYQIFEDVLENSPFVAIQGYDPDGKVLHWNKASYDIYGYTSDEVLGKSFETVKMFQDIAEEFRAELKGIIESGKPIPPREWEVTKADGTVCRVLSSLFPVFWEGKVVEVFCMDIDVTNFHNALQELNLQKVYFQQLFSNSPEAVAVLDTNDKIIDCNNEFEILFGFSKDEAINQRINDLIVPEDRASEAEEVSKKCSAGERVILETIRKNKDGKQFHVSLADAPILLDGKPIGAYMLYRDISARKKGEESLKLNQKRLEVLVSLSHMAEKSINEIIHFVIEEAVSLTGSQYGYLAFANHDETILEMYDWSEMANKDNKVGAISKTFVVKNTGLWGDAVRKRIPIIINEYEKYIPAKKTMPKGHVPLYRYLSIPVFDGKKIVMVAGVANKDDDYNESDLLQLSLLMDSLWSILRKRKADEDLRISEEKYRQIFEAAPIGIIHYDKDGILTDCNDTHLKIIGAKREKVTGYDLVAGTNSVEMTEAIQRSLQGQSTHFSGPYKTVLTQKDIIISVEFRPIFDENKNVKGGMGMITDITELSNAQEALIKSEAQHRLVTEKASDIIVRYFLNGTISFISPSAERLTGYSLDEISSAKIHDFLHPEEAHVMLQYLDQLLQGLQPFYIHMRLRNKNGKYIWFQCITQLVQLDGLNSEFITFCRDITEQIRNEEIIREKEAAELANKAKSMFLANMSHEIRNPMNAITGMISSIAKTELSKEQEIFVNSLRISSGNLMGIINDILDLSKIEAGKIEMVYSDFTQQDLIEDFRYTYSSISDMRQITFSTECECENLYLLRGDLIKVKQMLNNMLSNAFKFTEKGNVSLVLSEKDKTENRITIKFDIIDTGIGIKKEDFHKIYHVFTQVDSSTTKSFSGTGLGLAIVKKYAEMMGGEAYFESIYNKGSVFTIEIPFTYSETTEKPTVIIQKKPQQPTPSLKILLAEDDGINQLYMKGLLEENGFFVDAAFNGIQALELHSKKTFDVILMDGQMPKMDGFEATRKIREREKKSGIHTPIIAITGYAISGDKEKFIEAGMDDYVTKPIDEQLLIACILKAVQQKN
ncbi:MAG: PAS domain S-box protein [Bacteroidota bacterium]